MKLLDVVARWPGSSNDLTNLNNCRLKRNFEINEFPNDLLLGS